MARVWKLAAGRCSRDPPHHCRLIYSSGTHKVTFAATRTATNRMPTKITDKDLRRMSNWPGVRLERVGW